MAISDRITYNSITIPSTIFTWSNSTQTPNKWVWLKWLDGLSPTYNDFRAVEPIVRDSINLLFEEILEEIC